MDPAPLHEVHRGEAQSSDRPPRPAQHAPWEPGGPHSTHRARRGPNRTRHRRRAVRTEFALAGLFLSETSFGSDPCSAASSFLLRCSVRTRAPHTVLHEDVDAGHHLERFGSSCGPSALVIRTSSPPRLVRTVGDSGHYGSSGVATCRLASRPFGWESASASRHHLTLGSALGTEQSREPSIPSSSSVIRRAIQMSLPDPIKSHPIPAHIRSIPPLPQPNRSSTTAIDSGARASNRIDRSASNRTIEWIDPRRAEHYVPPWCT